MNNQEKLLLLAKTAAANAYAPYSKFKVGAAVLSANGNFYSGCNVENISYPLGTCAEQSAVSAMVAGGDTKISEILIYADSKQLISPCGACRQRIAEFADARTVVLLASAEGIMRTFSIEELLPLCFKEF